LELLSKGYLQRLGNLVSEAEQENEENRNEKNIEEEVEKWAERSQEL